MSSPPAAGAGGSPEPNWYPDPSIPGYIRYWNGSSWVPGTSRPEPKQGDAPPTPPRGQAAPAGSPPAEETGPVFFDEPSSPAQGTPVPGAEPAGDPGGAADAGEPSASGADAGSAPGGTAGEPGASGEQPVPRPAAPGALPELRSRGGEVTAWTPDDDVSTSPVAAVGRGGPARGGDAPADPRTPFGQAPGGPDASAAPLEDPKARDQTIGIRRADLQGSWPRQVRELAQRDGASAAPAAPGTPPTPPGGRQVPPQPAAQEPAQPAHASPAQPLPGPAQPAHASPAQPLPGPAQPAHASPAQPLLGPAQPAYPSPGQPFPGPQPGPGQQPFPGQQPVPGQMPGQQQPAAQPSPPTQSGVLAAPQMTPLTEVGLRVGGTAPWETPFGASGQAYPAGLWRRFFARLLDALLPLAAAVAVALPLVDRARDHIQAKIDAVELAGVTETVWLVDGTTGKYLAAVLGAFLVTGLLLEVLPTALWGRTLGKAVFRIGVLDLSSQQKPGFGAALGRWLVHTVLGLLVIGLLNFLWCLWDRPWRQCWHDKAAGTFVARAARPSS